MALQALGKVAAGIADACSWVSSKAKSGYNSLKDRIGPIFNRSVSQQQTQTNVGKQDAIFENIKWYEPKPRPRAPKMEVAIKLPNALPPEKYTREVHSDYLNSTEKWKDESYFF